ncbi:hypothetical protein V6N12_030383 [Hibiscus sabdariffa]|uniref:Uncharacterized protein n=1 Tax=Hibiscus sabdariffa TaxID=183260 RepID=A0ABR2C0W1_9ROSI
MNVGNNSLPWKLNENTSKPFNGSLFTNIFFTMSKSCWNFYGKSLDSKSLQLARDDSSVDLVNRASLELIALLLISYVRPSISFTRK